MFKIDKDYNMFLNRGDQISIRLESESNFEPGDILKFSIVKEGNYGNIVFQKQFVVDYETDAYTITLTSEDTKIGNIIKEGEVTYWYEVELNGIDTVLGWDDNGPKLFVLWPEAPQKGV